MTVKSRKEAEDLLRSKAQTDEGFRKKLIADPKKVIASELGIELPANMKLTVLEESTSNVFLVLPPAATAPGELADSALDAVAGGAAKNAGKIMQSVVPGASVGNPLNPAGQIGSTKLPESGGA